MSIYEYDEERHLRQEREAAWEEGKEDTLIEMIRKKLKKGNSIAEIADALELDEDEIRRLMEKINTEV